MRDSMMPFYGYGFLLPKIGGLCVRAKFKVAISAAPIPFVKIDGMEWCGHTH